MFFHKQTKKNKLYSDGQIEARLAQRPQLPKKPGVFVLWRFPFCSSGCAPVTLCYKIDHVRKTSSRCFCGKLG